MSDARKIANLELNKETLRELTEQEGEQVQGGAAVYAERPSKNPVACRNGGDFSRPRTCSNDPLAC